MLERALHSVDTTAAAGSRSVGAELGKDSLDALPHSAESALRGVAEPRLELDLRQTLTPGNTRGYGDCGFSP